jgi:4-hydroxy-tetrahydrodipicolinate synthase
MANAMPKESVDLLNYAVDGEYDKARALYRALIDLFHLDTHVKLVQYIKLAENITAGYPEYVKAPRLMLEGEERRRTIEIVEKAIANVQALAR